MNGKTKVALRTLADLAKVATLCVAYVALAATTVAALTFGVCWGFGVAFEWRYAVGVLSLLALAASAIRAGVGKRG